MRTTLLFLALVPLSVCAERIHIEHIVPKLPHKKYSTFSKALRSSKGLPIKLNTAVPYNIPSPHPTPSTQKAAPNNTTSSAPNNTYTPPSGAKDPKDIAIAFASETYGLSPTDYKVSSWYTSDDLSVTHVYLRQLHKGVEVLNGDMSINVDAEGNIISHGSSFFPSENLGKAKAWSSSSSGFVPPTRAFKTMSKHLGLGDSAPKEKSVDAPDGSSKFELAGLPFVEGNVKAEQAYVQLSDTELVPTWKFNVPMSGNWFVGCVHADGSKMVFLNDWVSAHSYRAIPFNKDNPKDDGTELIKNPEYKPSSPLGWTRESENDTETGFTRGNNVYAQENIENSTNSRSHARPAIKNGVFDYPIDLKKEPDTYTNASTVNLFYVCNMMHDILYQYGFDEKAGNFQTNNFGKGGKDGDAVTANSQDGDGTNNSNFSTPPDGQPGRMRMYIYTVTKPKRDGALENGIIIHEYTHGLSKRLTGGPANSNCLPAGESGGMGEGWGDVLAFLLHLTPKSRPEDDFYKSYYAKNKPLGIRTYPYSTNPKTNPLTYKDLLTKGWTEVHKIGEIWANTLINVYWEVCKAMKCKFNSNWHSADKKSANTLFLQVLVNGMKLQPCRPSFVNARDAIIKAMELINKDLVCVLWRGFAKKGMGVNAKVVDSVAQEDYSVPDDCLKQ